MLAHQIPVILGGGFDPSVIFAEMPGAWFEPRQGSMWQENTGVTPTTSAGQTVGLLLGLDQNQQLGPRLETNGEFDTDTTGWSVRGDATVTRSTTYFPGGSIKISVVNGDTGATQTLSGLTIGKLYEVSALAYAPSANGVVNGAVISLAAAPNQANALSAQVNAEDVAQRLVIRFFATTTSYTLYLYCLNRGVQWGYGGDSAYFDNISVREILGNHASQATAANRPIYQVDANGRAYLEHISTQFLTASLPDLGGGVFSSNGSIYWATPTGMQSLHGQAISTSLSLPAANTNVYSCLVTPERLNAVYENKLRLYYLRLAGLL